MKTHPTPEEWMSFLYGEDSPARHAELSAHLQGCAACRHQVQTWRRSMSALDAWAVPPARRRARLVAPAVRRAAAAAVVLGLGLGLGRMTSPARPDVNQLTAALRAEMETKLASTREEFGRALHQQRSELAEAVHAAALEAAETEAEELSTRLARVFDERRENDRATFLAAFRELRERCASDYAALRQDLDTVAVNADDGFSQTREQLLQLATYTQPGPQ
jgi:hypothetical protein